MMCYAVIYIVRVGIESTRAEPNARAISRSGSASPASVHFHRYLPHPCRSARWPRRIRKIL